MLDNSEDAIRLIDFGSATTFAYLPMTDKDRALAEDDIGKNTTMAFRAPEQADLFRKQLINEKVDVWALGCMLYRLAFGMIPFEVRGLTH